MTSHWHDPDGTLHEVYSGAILIGDSCLGTLSYDSGRADLRWHRCSYAFFCRHCGAVWARIVMQDSRGEQQAFEPVVVACAKHPDYWNLSGSLLAGHLENLLDNLPPEALKREFELHLNQEPA